MKTTMTPEEITAASLQERLALAQSPDTADEILMLLVPDKKLDVRRALAERKGLSEQLMQLLVNDKSKDIRLRMANHPELKAEFQEILAGSREVAIRVALTGRNDVSDDLLMKLAAGSNRDVGLSILDSGTLSDELLLKLAANNNRDVGLAIVKRSTLSDELQEQLITHRNADVRATLARRNDVSDDLLMKLAASNSKDIGLALLGRTKLSDELLEKLVTHKSADVRTALATRTTLPDMLIPALMGDKNSDVVAAVAGRKDLSVECIEKLSTHKNKKIRAAIAARHDLPMTMIEEFAMEKNIEVFFAVVNRDDLPEHLIEKMLSEKSSTLRTSLAQRVPLRHDVIKALAQDESDKVRAVVAARSDIAKSMIETFAKDNSMDVRLTVAIRNDVSGQMRRQLLDGLAHETVDIDELLLYIEKMSNAHLIIADHKLKFGIDGDWKIDSSINYKMFGQLLPLLFIHPSSRVIQEIEINIDWRNYSFDQTLVALSAVNTLIDVKRISLDRDDIDLSMTNGCNLGVISKQQFPNLEYLSTECTLNYFQLDFPKLKEISMESSGNEFHEILLMLLKSNLPNLETLNISAGSYGVYSDSENYITMQLAMKDAHTIWPNLKSLAIGARHPYDWPQLFTAPLFGQLERLTINLDDPNAYGCYEDYDDEEENDECMTVMYKNLVDLMSALKNRRDQISRIGHITVGIGADFVNAAGGSYAKKIAILSAPFNCTIQYEVFVGGYE